MRSKIPITTYIAFIILIFFASSIFLASSSERVCAANKYDTDDKVKVKNPERLLLINLLLVP